MRNLCSVGIATFVFVCFFTVASFLADLVFALYTIYSDGLLLLLFLFLFLNVHHDIHTRFNSCNLVRLNMLTSFDIFSRKHAQQAVWTAREL